MIKHIDFIISVKNSCLGPTKLSTTCRIKIKNMSFRKSLFYTKNKASEAFSRDSNYKFDFMLRIKGQVLKSWQVQLFKHFYTNILNFLMILICLYSKLMYHK